MLFVRTVITKKTAELYSNPSPASLAEAAQLLNFLKNVQAPQLNEGFSFQVEAAKDADGNVYRDVHVTIDSQFTMNDDRYLVSTSGIAVNIQPLINFLTKIISQHSV